MSDRRRDEHDIGQLYGTDGPIGGLLLRELLAEMGLDALTDAAVAKLAALHRQEDDRGSRRGYLP